MFKNSNLLQIYFSIGLLSAAIIAYQIIMIQLLSITQWYHFAFMVISIALLGFGAAGTFLSIFKDKLIEYHQILFPLLLFLTGLLMSIVLKISNLSIIRFDSFLLINDPTHIWHLIVTYLLFFLPFFCGALAIGLSFLIYKNQIAKIYFANLTGSGIGGIIIIIFMWIFPLKHLPVIISFLPLISGIIQLKKIHSYFIKTLAGLSGLIVILMLFFPAKLILSEYKSLSKTLLLPDAKVIAEKTSPFGLTQIVSSPVLRYVPGLSLNYKQPVPINKVIFVNANWAGTIKGLNDTASTKIISHTTNNLPFLINKPKNILLLNTGICEFTSYAIYKNAEKLTITEPNSTIISTITSELNKYSDSLLFHPSVDLRNIEARTFLSLTTSQYDLIILPTIGTFGGNMGINAFQEQYIYTTNAFEEMWEKLSDNGIISISCWMDYPVRKPLKILATIVEMLEQKGIVNIKSHISAIRNWNSITFAINKSPISPQQIDSIRSFCDKMSFDPLILSSLQEEEIEQYNTLNNDYFFKSIKIILSPERETLYETYDFNIIPATDNCPYFFQFIRWKNIKFLSGTYSNQTIPLLEIGYIIVIITFLQILILATILIILPLIRKKFKVKNKISILFYFGGIGIGYMFFEIILIQHFILYLGNPIYATTTVISLILISSGFGSYYSTRIKINRINIFRIFLLIATILITYAFTLIPILQHTISFSTSMKIGLMLPIIAIPGFIMGIPFPIGISYFSQKSTNEIPWAWGINGYFSVISAALATIIAVEIGFVWVSIIAGIIYLGTGITILKNLNQSLA